MVRSIAYGRAIGSGLTLIEMLVALALLALVLTLAYGSFAQISGETSRLEEELSDQEQLRLLLKLIGDDLLAARYFSNYAAGGNPSGILARMQFVGRSDFSTIGFHAVLPSRFFRDRPPELDPGVVTVGYAVQERSRSVVLTRRENYYLNPIMDSGGTTIDLVQNIDTFKLEFLQPPASPTQTIDNWVTEWNSSIQPDSARMPIAIRITLAIVGKDGKPLREQEEMNLDSILQVKQ
jgi:prepilin-type N-terminal cleavage/methylation domain-containing protein